MRTPARGRSRRSITALRLSRLTQSNERGDVYTADRQLLRHFVELFSGASDGCTNVVNVMVQLTTEAAHAVRGHELPAELREAEQNLRPLELALEPLHPGAGDSSLETWFRIL